MSHRNVRFESQDGIAIVTLARPERRNALSLETIEELTACLSGIDTDQDVRVVILAADGPVFSAGHDLRELAGDGARECGPIFAACAALMLRIQSLTKPVIAEVQGLATAAGCQLVATCDLAVASSAASFATPGVRIGLFCTTPTVALSRSVGRKRALQMLLTGDAIDAGTACHWGLVNQVVPPAELRNASLQLARKIAAASALTIASGKQSFYRQLDLGVETAYDYATAVMTESAATRDAQEGITAFLEKRTPAWSGR